MSEKDTWEPDRVELQSMDVAADKRARLRQVFPEVFCEDKIDFDQLRRVLGEGVAAQDEERFGLRWWGKAECLRTLQQPSHATLRPVREESVDFDTTENLFIEGDNLEVLKLLQKAYFEKVKMIYIDPPYNTGKEFIYPDKYQESLETYLRYTGQIDGNGQKFSTNTDRHGRYHSCWLNMMYARLYVAKNLLREDGVIFISIDDHEQAHLRLLCDHIFGEENFVNNIVWQKKYSPSNDAKWLSDNHDFIMCYTKNKDIWRPNLLPRTDEQNQRYFNPDNDPRGDWKSSDLSVKTYSAKYDYPIMTLSGKEVCPPHGSCWRVSKEKFTKLVRDNRIWFGENGNNVPSIKRFLNEVKGGITPLTLWTYEEVGHNQEGRKELKELFDGKGYFDGPKPIRLLQRAMTIAGVSDDDIVLDFFAGSCTTAHAVMQLNAEDGGNRKYICVQLPEPCEEKSEAFKAGYKTIADIGKERIRRAAQKIAAEHKDQLDLKDTNKLDLGFKVFKLDRSNFRIWNGEGSLHHAIEGHTESLLDIATPEDLLYEIMLAEGIPLDTSVEKMVLEGKNVFSIHYDDLHTLICLNENLTQELMDSMGALKPQVVIFLDKGFDDQLKTNAYHTFKSGALQGDNEIVFKVV